MRTLLIFFALAVAAFAQTSVTPATGKFPAMIVQPIVATKQRPEPGSFYRKTMTVEAKMMIEGTSRLSPIPAAEATIVIITMNTLAKYKENREAYSVYEAATIKVPEAKTGEKRQFDLTEFKTTFDGYRDSSNVGGEVYRYYVFGLRDPETKGLIDFKTNNPGLANLCKTSPEKREEFLNMSKGKSFPATFR